MCFHQDVLCHHGPKATEPKYELKPLKPWSQIKLFSYKLFIAYILSHHGKLCQLTLASELLEERSKEAECK
jgi:hypothetical protein